MKTLFVITLLVAGISGQAFSMGHPHNVFAARKQMRTKTSASVVKPKVTSSVGWQHAVQVTKTTLGDRLLTALAHVRPARPY